MQLKIVPYSNTRVGGEGVIIWEWRRAQYTKELNGYLVCRVAHNYL